MNAVVYSRRLGAISDAQLAAAAARLGLGAFVSATPVSGGMHGQNLFLETTAGAFVLRGAPHWVMGKGDTAYRRDDRLQFTKEAFFIRQAHEHTRAPVPWPCLHDEASDIFGWPYLVMPRMPGDCFNERTIRKALAPDEQGQVAAAAGATLAELQRLTSTFAGDFDADTIALTPDPGGYAAHMIARMRRSAELATAEGVMTTGDMDWIEGVIRDAAALPARPVTFVHGDYKLDNMTVTPGDGAWRVGGVFDFHTARFGDGAFDLVHITCGYLDTAPDMARVFVDAWRTDARAPDVVAWIPLYLVANRVGLWQFFTQGGARPAWSQGKTFRAFAEPYLDRMLAQL